MGKLLKLKKAGSRQVLRLQDAPLFNLSNAYMDLQQLNMRRCFQSLIVGAYRKRGENGETKRPGY